MRRFHNIQASQSLIHAYGQWIHDYRAHNWNCYFFTFVFDNIPGSDTSRIGEMKEQLGWFYGRLAKASVPRPSQEKWSAFLPRAILVPDFPVFKNERQSLREITINNGLHWHGLVVQPPLPRRPKLQEDLDTHVMGNLHRYLVGNIRRIDVVPIKERPQYVTGYGMKALTKGRISQDEVLIFPRSVGELPTNQPIRAAGERPTYDFQRMRVTGGGVRGAQICAALEVFLACKL
jgi:hypothetical protein